MQALMRSLEGLLLRERGGPGQKAPGEQEPLQWEADAAYLHQMVDEIIRQRHVNGPGAGNSMLDYLLASNDWQGGEKFTSQELLKPIAPCTSKCVAHLLRRQSNGWRQ
jgi:hypothetical protein